MCAGMSEHRRAEQAGAAVVFVCGVGGRRGRGLDMCWVLRQLAAGMGVLGRLALEPVM